MILRTLPFTLAKGMASVSTGIISGKSKGLRKALLAAWSAADFGLTDKPHLDSRKDLLFAAFSGIKWIARKEEMDRKTLRRATVSIMDLIRKEKTHEENWSLVKGRSIFAVTDVLRSELGTDKMAFSIRWKGSRKIFRKEYRVALNHFELNKLTRSVGLKSPLK
mgnify:CR=1 FL=1